MNVSFARQWLALGFSTLLLLTVSGTASAQTSRARTPAKTAARPATTAQPAPRYAYEHGYLAGYDDGYAQGRAGFNENQPRDFANNQAYRAADRGYTDRLGTRIEYQEGYRVGFELGNSDGYYGRTSTRTIPANLSRVVVGRINAADIVSNDPSVRPRTEEPRYTPPPSSTADRRQSEPTRTNDRVNDRTRTTNSRGPLVIPDGVQMKIRLIDQINTKTNREGDKFTAIVLDPSEYADAQVMGHIAKLNKAGKATGKTELVLVFDSIQMRNGGSGRFAAQVERIYESESVKSVDEEGNVESGSRTKETATRTAGGAVLGAIIGGIAGGGKGAAIGAAIGAGLGVGSVYIDGGKDLILEPGTEMLIRSAGPARARD